MQAIPLFDFGPQKTYCFGLSTRVLCADLTWRPLKSLGPGDNLLCYDEWPAAARKHRVFRPGVITSYDKITWPCYRMRFEGSREVVCSGEHYWLAGRERGGLGPRTCDICSRTFASPAGWGAHRRVVHGVDSDAPRGTRERDWLRTSDLQPGARIKDLGMPWTTDPSRDAGYLAGLIDGEGSLSGRAGFQIQFAQRPGPVMDLADRLYKERGYWFRRSRQNDRTDVEILLVGGLYDCLRLLGEIRPVRLLAKAGPWLEGRSPFPHTGGSRRGLPRNTGLRMESLEFAGDQKAVTIGTSTKTLIAEGLFGHDSTARTAGLGA